MTMNITLHYYAGYYGGIIILVLVTRAWYSKRLWRHVPHHCTGYVAMAGNAWRCRRCDRLPADYDPAKDTTRLTR
jgi:hypothetical protein